MIDIRNMSEGERIAVDCGVRLNIPPAYGAVNSPVDVTVSGEISKIGERFFVKCACFAEIVLKCALCLAPAPVLIDFKLDEVFSEAESGDEIWQITDNTIDIKPAVESDLYSLIPMKQLCGGACKGLDHNFDNFNE